MKKILTSLIAGVMALSLVACNGGEATPPPEGSTPATGSVDLTEVLGTLGLEGDSYEGLEISIAQTKEVLTPGEKFVINVTIKNTGDKTIIFAKGSGSNTVPDAITVVGRNVTRDLGTGAATTDFQTETLEAGAEVSYSIDLMVADEPVIPADVGDFADTNALVLFFAIEGEGDSAAFAPTAYASEEFTTTLTIPSESK